MDIGGLRQEWGLEQTVTAAGGEYQTTGDLRQIDIKIDLTKLTSTPTLIPGGSNIFFPAGVRIESVEITMDTAGTSGGAATLDIGLQQTNLTTEIDYQAFVKAAAVATLTAGQKLTITKGGTAVGDNVGTGTSTANVGYITANYNTAAFTAGVIHVRINYRKP
jgi:hypothetical protein